MRKQPPHLRSLATVPASVLQALPAVPREGVELFLITTEGIYDDVFYAAGELIVCRGEARSGDTTVLVPRGHGRPRLGRIESGRLLGDGGEPCHPARWGCAGRVVARYRRESDGWIIELQESTRGREPDAEGGTRGERAEVGEPLPSASVAAEGEGKAPSAAQPAPLPVAAIPARAARSAEARKEATAKSGKGARKGGSSGGAVQLGLFAGQRVG